MNTTPTPLPPIVSRDQFLAQHHEPPPSAKASHTRAYPCPVCGGYRELRQHQGTRCYGFTTADAIYCTREELAGGSPYVETANAYRHTLGTCRGCGAEHNGEPPAGDARAPGERSAQHWRHYDALYWYIETGRLIAQKVRFGHGPEKATPWRHPSGHGWVAGLDRPLADLPLYNTDQLRAAPRGALVIVNEGEKAADAATDRGLLATCPPGGAGSWQDRYADDLAGQHVIVIADHDAPGQTHAATVAASLATVAASVRVLTFTELGEHADLADFFERGGALEALYHRALTAPPFQEGTPTPPAGRAQTDMKLREARRLIDRIGDYVAEDTLGEEVRLLIGLAIAHYRSDPKLERRSSTDWRLTQGLAAQLCGKAAAATAGGYIAKLSRKGLLPRRPDQPVEWEKPDGTRIRGAVVVYSLPDPEDADPETVAAQNATVLLSRAKRLQERRETRGDARRFEACPACGADAGIEMKAHCKGCGRELKRRKRNVFTTTPARRPSRLKEICGRTRAALQSLQSRPVPLALIASAPADPADDTPEELLALRAYRRRAPQGFEGKQGGIALQTLQSAPPLPADAPAAPAPHGEARRAHAPALQTLQSAAEPPPVATWGNIGECPRCGLSTRWASSADGGICRSCASWQPPAAAAGGGA